MSVESELQTALDEAGRFEALALIQLKTDKLLFLKAAPDSVAGLKDALEALLLRAVTDTESISELQEGEDVVYYDLKQRQIILTLFKTKKDRYLLAAVIAPGKTYKQILKRLTKSLKTLL